MVPLREARCNDIQGVQGASMLTEGGARAKIAATAATATLATAAAALATPTRRIGNASGIRGREESMTTTRIFLVRHGATVLSAEDRFAGSTNVELSKEG